MDVPVTSVNGRTAAYPIDPLLLELWSPRSFIGEAISEAELRRYSRPRAGRQRRTKCSHGGFCTHAGTAHIGSVSPACRTSSTSPGHMRHSCG